MPTYLQMIHDLDQDLRAIGYIPFDFETYNLFEYLMFNLYENYTPHYSITIIPNYWKFVLEDVKKLRASTKRK
jgi:hypothetical protein